MCLPLPSHKVSTITNNFISYANPCYFSSLILNKPFILLNCTQYIGPFSKQPLVALSLSQGKFLNLTLNGDCYLNCQCVFYHIVNLFMLCFSFSRFRFLLLVLSDYSLTSPRILEHLSYHLLQPMILNELSSTSCGYVHCSKLPLFNHSLPHPINLGLSYLVLQ